MAVFETWLKSDLQRPLNVVQLTGNLFSADNGGNLIGVEVYNSGSPASISGSVMGYIIRADGATVTVQGTLDGNKAYIVLPLSAYAKVGEVRIVIKVGTMTVGACVSYVYQTTTDTIVDPGHVVPSIDELLAQIGACRTATTNANKVANLTVSAEAATGSTPDAILSEDSQTGNKHITFKLARGAKGDTGNTGATGATPNISIGTVQSGATPSASMTGTPENPVLNMTLPKGDAGDDATVYIRYSAVQPTRNSDMKTTPDDWIGIYAGYAATAPTSYTSYTWYKIKGEPGSIDNASAETIPMSSTDSTKIYPVLTGKADKVSGGTTGNLVSLDENGNLQDSGSAAGDFITSHQDVSGKANANALAKFANGDTHGALSSGEYIYVANHNLLAAGLYQATTNIAQNAALTTSNTTPVVNGLAGQVYDTKNRTSGICKAGMSITSNFKFVLNMPNGTMGMILLGNGAPANIYMTSAGAFGYSSLPANWSAATSGNNVTFTKTGSAVEQLVSFILFQST